MSLYTQSHSPKYALVTGASYGIGAALSKELTLQGWTVIGLARSLDRLKHMQTELPESTFLPYFCDVGDSSSITQVTTALKIQGITPQLFFLNAGKTREHASEPSKETSTNFHKSMFDVNYFGVIQWVEEWENTCLENGGATFMTTSSINAHFAPPQSGAYAASKAALVRAFEDLSLRHIDDSLHFSYLICGSVDSRGDKTGQVQMWPPQRMAKYMIKKAEKKQSHCEPQWIESILFKILHILPNKWTLKLMNWIYR